VEGCWDWNLTRINLCLAIDNLSGGLKTIAGIRLAPGFSRGTIETDKTGGATAIAAMR